MIPIPEYLKDYATLKKNKTDTVSFSISCSCGNTFFVIMENYFTKEEKALSKPYYDALTLLDSRGPEGYFGSMYTIDEDGKGHHWKLLSADGKKRMEVIVPERPFFSSIDVIKAVCSVCGKEMVLFDSRKNGYDGMISEHEKENEYIPHFRQKGKSPYQIEIIVENDPSLEDFREASSIDCSFEFYSDSFSWIRIYGINETGKKKKLFDIETA